MVISKQNVPQNLGGNIYIKKSQNKWQNLSKISRKTWVGTLISKISMVHVIKYINDKF